MTNTSLKTAFVSLRKLYSEVSKLDRQSLYSALFASTATVLSSTGLMSLSAYLISFAALQPSIADVLVPVTAVRFFGIARAVFRYAERMISHQSVFKLLSQLRTWIFKSVVSQKSAQLLKLQTNDLFNTLSADIESLQDFYLRTFLPLGTSLILSLLYAGLLLFIHPLASLLFLGLYSLSALGASYLAYVQTKGSSKAVLTLQQGYKLLLNEYGEGMIDLITNNRLTDYETELKHLETQLYLAEKSTANWRFIGAFIQQLLQHAAVMLSLLVAVLSVESNQLPGVWLATFILAAFTLFEAAPNVLTLFQKIESSGHSAERILSLRSEDSSKAISAHSNPIDLLEEGLQLQRIHLDHLSCGYEIGQDVLKDIHINFLKGEKVAIVGETGSGKSTLAKALCGLVEYSHGQIYGETKDFKVNTLCPSLSVVEQHVYLFNRTLRDNLLLGNLTATDNELISALNAVGLSCTQKDLDTVTGLGGHSFSGGEKQRVAMARALLKPSSFVLLDEATAGLDHTTENLVLEPLLKGSRLNGRGLIWITHRLLHMDALDVIYVLKDGKIIETGTHRDLLDKGGHYAGMWAVQEDRKQLLTP